jgi:hypothetical protein
MNDATKEVLAGIGAPDLASRYPDRAHFIAAANPRHGKMATAALCEGDPVVLVYPEGLELLMTPEKAPGMAAVLMRLAAGWLALRSRKGRPGAIQIPPRVRIEARDSAGLPIAG